MFLFLLNYFVCKLKATHNLLFLLPIFNLFRSAFSSCNYLQRTVSYDSGCAWGKNSTRAKYSLMTNWELDKLSTPLGTVKLQFLNMWDFFDKTSETGVFEASDYGSGLRFPVFGKYYKRDHNCQFWLFCQELFRFIFELRQNKGEFFEVYQNFTTSVKICHYSSSVVFPSLLCSRKWNQNYKKLKSLFLSQKDGLIIEWLHST